MTTFRVLTYVTASRSGYKIVVTSIHADLEHSTPLVDMEAGEAGNREEALRLRGELVERLIAKIGLRGDSVIQVREIGDFDFQG
jgi:hypothetical protein